MADRWRLRRCVRGVVVASPSSLPAAVGPTSMTLANEEPAALERALTFYDVTNVTVGAIVGADIYITAAITAGILGPASLLAWVFAAVLATVIALMMAECARMVPEVG